jgi:hypothetical protein
MTSGFESGTNSRLSAVWKLGLAGLLASGSVALLTLQIFPTANGPFSVLAAELGLRSPAHQFPKGQLKADARTLISALEYLILPRSNWDRPIFSPTSSPATNQPLQAKNGSGLTGLGISLHQAEDVTFGVLAVCKPSDARDGHFGQRDRTTLSLCLPDRIIDGRSIHRANVTYDGGSVDFPSALDQTAVDAGLASRTGGDQPIGLWPIPLFELPAEKVLVELDCPFGVFRVNFEVDNACHS